ncbi:FAD-dependent oxidoreductase [Patescibacteria group bacterium]|nr:FAD-dependent oxidoreductase [Patescibacteria group bacterium]
MKFIEHILDKYTMYQVLITVLSVYIISVGTLSLFGVLRFTLTDITLSLGVIVVTALLAHYLLARVTKAPANIWSTVITALILFLLFTPTSDFGGILALAAIAALAVTSKYVVRYRNVHLVNPVALAAVLAGVFGLGYATWWVANLFLAPILIIGGLVITHKIRRLPMVLVGILTSIIMVGVYSLLRGSFGFDVFYNLLLTSPLWFFMTIMVTEPLSTPAGAKAQMFYGGFIGLLSQIPFAIGPFFNSPELALVIANLLVWPMTLRGRLTLTLQKVREVTANTFEYSFKPSFPFTFEPGQYLEWALPHTSPDGRGTRRYFTIASAPAESNVRLVVRHSSPGSTYKEALRALKRNESIFASQLAGDFTLPLDISAHRYLFVAGGIGITPFMSYIADCLHSHITIDAQLLYCNKSVQDIAYADYFKKAESIGLQTTHVLVDPSPNWLGETGFLDVEKVKRMVPDVAERIVYISGPPGMVGAYKKMFIQIGVPSNAIKTDYFPGLA